MLLLQHVSMGSCWLLPDGVPVFQAHTCTHSLQHTVDSCQGMLVTRPARHAAGMPLPSLTSLSQTFWRTSCARSGAWPAQHDSSVRSRHQLPSNNPGGGVHARPDDQQAPLTAADTLSATVCTCGAACETAALRFLLPALWMRAIFSGSMSLPLPLPDVVGARASGSTLGEAGIGCSALLLRVLSGVPPVLVPLMQPLGCAGARGCSLFCE